MFMIFSVDYSNTAVNDTFDIYNYLLEKNDIV